MTEEIQQSAIVDDPDEKSLCARFFEVLIEESVQDGSNPPSFVRELEEK